MFVVEKACRGQGIEGELIRIFLKEMQKKEAQYVTISASLESEPHKFYDLEKYGFLSVLGKFDKDSKQKQVVCMINHFNQKSAMAKIDTKNSWLVWSQASKT